LIESNKSGLLAIRRQSQPKKKEEECQPVERAGTGSVNDMDSSVFYQIIFFFIVFNMASIKGSKEFQLSHAVLVASIKSPSAIIVMLVDVDHSQSINVSVLLKRKK
jgi:hypothetical protein